MTIAEAAARCGLPESTLRYWERIGLVNRVERDASSGHRRYRPEDVATLETLGNLRAVGLSIEDMRAYLASARRGVAAHLLSEAGRTDVGRGYRNGHCGRAADRPLNPGEQLIDLPTVVTSHGHVKFMHSLTSSRSQAARPAAGGATAANPALPSSSAGFNRPAPNLT